MNGACNIRRNPFKIIKIFPAGEFLRRGPLGRRKLREQDNINMNFRLIFT
jgi:hypothetical protein